MHEMYVKKANQIHNRCSCTAKKRIALVAALVVTLAETLKTGAYWLVAQRGRSKLHMRSLMTLSKDMGCCIEPWSNCCV